MSMLSSSSSSLGQQKSRPRELLQARERRSICIRSALIASTVISSEIRPGCRYEPGCQVPINVRIPSEELLTLVMAIFLQQPNWKRGQEPELYPHRLPLFTYHVYCIIIIHLREFFYFKM